MQVTKAKITIVIGSSAYPSYHDEGYYSCRTVPIKIDTLPSEKIVDVYINQSSKFTETLANYRVDSGGQMPSCFFFFENENTHIIDTVIGRIQSLSEIELTYNDTKPGYFITTIGKMRKATLEEIEIHRLLSKKEIDSIRENMRAYEKLEKDPSLTRFRNIEL